MYIKKIVYTQEDYQLPAITDVLVAWGDVEDERNTVWQSTDASSLTHVWSELTYEELNPISTVILKVLFQIEPCTSMASVTVPGKMPCFLP